MTGIFENDGALDWLNDFTEHPDVIKIKSAFRLTGNSTDYPDAIDCEEALAAAAVVVSIYKNSPKAGLPHETFDKIKSGDCKVDKELIREALQSSQHILSNSELRDLWEEEDLFEDWELSVKELLDELEHPSQT